MARHSKAIFDVIQVRMPSLGAEAGPGEPMVWIVDRANEFSCISVTNDAEEVCERVHAVWPHHRIFYRDTDGRWDELVHLGGKFERFAPADEHAIPVPPVRSNPIRSLLVRAPEQRQ